MSPQGDREREFVVIRVGGMLIAQGYKCSCGVIGCTRHPEPKA